MGRSAYKKVVSQSTRNYGEPFEKSLPGPGEYDPKNVYEFVPTDDFGMYSSRQALKSGEKVKGFSLRP